jgi:hypothetical protein
MSRNPFPSRWCRPNRPPRGLVVVLARRADTLQRLQDSGMAGIIQDAWPDAMSRMHKSRSDFYKGGHRAAAPAR